MAESLTLDELEATREFLKKVNEIRVKHESCELSFKTAVKFMMARKFDVRRAVALYEAHEITRFRENLARFDPNSEPLKTELNTGKFTVLPSRDANGSAIVMFTAAKHSPLSSGHQITLQAMVYQLDTAVEDMKTQRSGIVFIYNMANSKYSNFDYELSQKILGLLKGAYPARLKKVLIVMAPLWFKAPFKILRLFVREKLRDRVFMVGTSQLPSHIPIASLPAELGGALKLEHKKWIEQCLKTSAEVEKEVGGLSDLASFNKKFTCSGMSGMDTNGAILNDYSGQRLSEDDECSSASSSANGAAGDSNGPSTPLNGNSTSVGPNHNNHHHQGSCDGVQGVIRKHKPEKIIMPSQILTTEQLQDSNGKEGKRNSDLLIDFDHNIYDEVSAGDEDLSQKEFLHSDSDPGLTLEEFIQDMKQKGRRGLFEEYNEIKARSVDGYTFFSSRIRENQAKNRYTDVLCFDHSRVKLPLLPEDDPSSDYINANYVDGYMQKKAFISTQGPLPKTFNDFWRMIWEERVVVIVMTTRTVERCRQKCGQYWPLEEESSQDYGQFQVFNNSVEQFQDYVISSLILSDTKTGITREVTHMIFNSWPDYGVPPSALAMLDFRDKVREHQSKGVSALGSLWTGHPLGPPIVVHCSAGIGRTGTFITLDISIMRLEAVQKIDVKRTVEKIRSQRAYSIQMPDQYVFCYLALLEYALSRGLLQDVDLSGFDGESESELED